MMRYENTGTARTKPFHRQDSSPRDCGRLLYSRGKNRAIFLLQNGIMGLSGRHGKTRK